ncbi:MAG: Flp pilus assembly complex ATPase component TadA [Acidothermus sp.]|nr:Flp pilus assembly complex ATPase component TadA [Acidothermus sp.]
MPVQPIETPAAELPQRRRLGDVLIERDLLTREQLEEVLAAQRRLTGKDRKRLGQLLVEMGYLTERQVAQALAELLALELVDGNDLAVPMEVARLLPRQVAERARVLILGRTEDGLKVATADPTNVVALDDVRAYTGAHSLSVVVAPESVIKEQIARVYSMAAQAQFDAHTDEATRTDLLEDAELARAADQAPTVRLVNQILTDAIRMGASDVHIEQQSDGVWVRHRIDGVLRDVTRVHKGAAPALISRLKIVSGMNIAEKRLPQDGRMKIETDGVTTEARVSTLPAIHGEKVVIRLLASAERITQIDGLGMEPDQRETLLEAANSPQGLILITGPTGSGKTNTLYSVLTTTASREKNVVTLEDPVEIQLPGITQVQIDPRSGFTFANGLRAVLRQDPDVILVGEVRDAETASLALEAALTGHLVLTTVHTNNAPAAVTRLVEMGAEPFLVASSLRLVVAQRLVRRPCSGCVKPYQPDEDVLRRLGVRPEALASARPLRGVGCMECNGTGYRGRTGVFEVFPITAETHQIVLRTPTEAAVAEVAARAGMRTLREAALAKAWRGETTFEEVLRVC